MVRRASRARGTKRESPEARSLLQTAAHLQGMFWDAVLELEDHLGVLIDETRDLSDWTVRQIRSCSSDDVGPVSWRDKPAPARKLAKVRPRSRRH